MATTARLGIDITAIDRTRAAFASVERNMATVARTAQQFKFIMAGFFGGEVLQAMVRNFIEVAKQSAPVKTAMDNLNTAWLGFAQNVGKSGLNEALINFANRMGAMILNTDGLSASIGKLMGGAVNVMGAVFEAVGRSIAFAHDNAAIFARFIAAWGLVAFAQRVLGVATAFYFWAKSVRATGIVMAAFSAISRANLMVFLALAAGIAYATDSLDQLRSGLDAMWAKVREVFPQIGGAVSNAMENLGFDMSALSADIYNAVKYVDKLGQVSVPGAEKVAKLGAATKGAADKVKIGTSAFSAFRSEIIVTKDVLQEAGEAAGQKFRDLFDGLVSGSMRATDALRAFAIDALKSLGQVFLSRGFQQLGALLTGGVAPSQQGGFLYGLIGSFAGMFANGGSIGAGQWGLVGERGLEIVEGPATVTPLRGGVGGTTIVYNIDARGAQRGVAEDIKRMMDQRDRALPAKIRDSRRRGMV